MFSFQLAESAQSLLQTALLAGSMQSKPDKIFALAVNAFTYNEVKSDEGNQNYLTQKVCLRLESLLKTREPAGKKIACSQAMLPFDRKPILVSSCSLVKDGNANASPGGQLTADGIQVEMVDHVEIRNKMDERIITTFTEDR